jgi:peptide/nickel transport system substrate-binding protein
MAGSFRTAAISRREFLVSGAAAVLGLGLWSCAPAAPSQPVARQPAGQPNYGGTLVFVLEDDVIDFDPMRSRAFVDRNVHYQIYDSLVRIDPKGNIIPWLAERWEISPDGKTVTFYLRQDVKFHDGTAFDASVVKWNIERYITAEGSARRGELEPVASVDVIDTYTVRFNLKRPFSPLLAQLVDRAGMMVSPKAVEAAGADFTRKAFKAGTGPFILTEAVKDDHITLERNPEWWGKDQLGNRLPYVDKIIVRPIRNGDVRLANLRTGEAQVANNIPAKDVASVKSDPTLSYQQVPGYEYLELRPNSRPGFVFNERRYIKAVSMAIDRREILDKVFFGIGAVAYGAIAPPHFAYDPNFKPFERPDPEGAKRLVAEVGKGQLQFEFLVPSGDPQTLQLAQLIQAQLAKADIKAEIVQMEFAQILQLEDQGQHKGLVLGRWSGRIDPDANIYDRVYTGQRNNTTGYSNPEVDRLLDEQRMTYDQNRRRELLRRAEQIYAVDDPARVWYRFSAAMLVTNRRVRGLEVYPDQIIRFQYAWLEK